MNEQTARYVKMLKTHVDRIFIVVLYALLVAIIYLWWSEQDNSTQSQAPPTTAKLDDKVALNPEYRKIATLAEPQDIARYPEVDQIRKYNMFDYKALKDKELIEQEAQRKLLTAKEAVAKGQTEEAKRLLGEILRTFPAHRGAKDLMDQLSGGKASGSASPDSAAASAPPAAAAPSAPPAAAAPSASPTAGAPEAQPTAAPPQGRGPRGGRR